MIVLWFRLCVEAFQVHFVPKPSPEDKHKRMNKHILTRNICQLDFARKALDSELNSWENIQAVNFKDILQVNGLQSLLPSVIHASQDHCVPGGGR